MALRVELRELRKVTIVVIQGHQKVHRSRGLTLGIFAISSTDKQATIWKSFTTGGANTTKTNRDMPLVALIGPGDPNRRIHQEIAVRVPVVAWNGMEVLHCWIRLLR